MEKYHLEEDVPWKDILAIIRRRQEMSLSKVKRGLEREWFIEENGDLESLRLCHASSKSLRRFLGLPETTLDQKTEELLKRLEP